MTHLRIELNNIQENVSSAVIEKLYELASSGDLDLSSNLAGNLYTPITYRAYIQYLTTLFPDLHINADNYAIPFEDPNMVTYLNSIGVGSNGMITEALAAAATIVANSANTTVTKFNELRYFTNITESRGGYSGMNSGLARFANWTALEEVDISNYTTIGHNNAAAYEDTFVGCTALKTVTASNRLYALGHNAFSLCTNLEDIIGLSGTIEVCGGAFDNCQKLKPSIFSNIEIRLRYTGGYTFFKNYLLTTLTLSNQTTEIPNSCFEDCTNLELVNVSGDITLYERAFWECTKLTSTGFTNARFKINNNANHVFKNNQLLLEITLVPENLKLGNAVFENCSSLTTINNSQYITKVGEYDFYNCSALTSLNLSGLANSSENTFFGQSCFYNCKNLTTLGVLSFPYITSLGRYVFLGCEKLEGLLLFPNIATMDSGNYGANFNNCKKITKIQLGHIQKLDGGSGFSSSDRALFGNCTRLKVADLGDSLVLLYGTNFYNDSALEAVIINTPDPPYNGYDWQTQTNHRSSSTLDNMFGNSTVNIYVPDAAVSTYLSTLPYSDFPDHIKPISQYNEASILGS